MTPIPKPKNNRESWRLIGNAVFGQLPIAINRIFHVNDHLRLYTQLIERHVTIENFDSTPKPPWPLDCTLAKFKLYL